MKRLSVFSKLLFMRDRERDSIQALLPKYLPAVDPGLLHKCLEANQLSHNHSLLVSEQKLESGAEPRI